MIRVVKSAPYRCVLPPVRVPENLQAQVALQYALPKRNVIYRKEVPEDVQPDDYAFGMLYTYTDNICFKLREEVRVRMVKPVRKRHVVAVAVGPLLT